MGFNVVGECEIVPAPGQFIDSFSYNRSAPARLIFRPFPMLRRAAAVEAEDRGRDWRAHDAARRSGAAAMALAGALR